MVEQADRIEEHIRQQRDELGQNLSELQQRVKDTVDWRTQFDHRPMTMIGLAMAGGFLLSAAWGSKRRSRNLNDTSDRQRWTPENHSTTSYNSATNEAAVGTSNKTSESVRAIKAALVGLAAARLGNVIESILPGFNEEYNRVKNSDHGPRPSRAV